MNRIKKDFSDEKWLSSLIESYQNAQIAENIGKANWN